MREVRSALLVSFSTDENGLYIQKVLDITQMSKYVPPQLRKRQENKVEEKPLPPPEKPYEEEFPNLRNAPSKMNVWGGAKKFSDLARDWDTKDKQEKQIKKIEESQKNVSFARNYVHLPRFHNKGNFVEPEDEEQEQVEEKQETNPDDPESGWVTVVNKKPRKKKNMEEIADRPPTPEENTVWNQQEETCWDDSV